MHLLCQVRSSAAVECPFISRKFCPAWRLPPTRAGLARSCCLGHVARLCVQAQGAQRSEERDVPIDPQALVEPAVLSPGHCATNTRSSVSTTRKHLANCGQQRRTGVGLDQESLGAVEMEFVYQHVRRVPGHVEDPGGRTGVGQHFTNRWPFMPGMTRSVTNRSMGPEWPAARSSAAAPVSPTRTW